jgi:hypothetical protein
MKRDENKNIKGNCELRQFRVGVHFDIVFVKGNYKNVKDFD